MLRLIKDWWKCPSTLWSDFSLSFSPFPMDNKSNYDTRQASLNWYSIQIGPIGNLFVTCIDFWWNFLVVGRVELRICSDFLNVSLKKLIGNCSNLLQSIRSHIYTFPSNKQWKITRAWPRKFELSIFPVDALN